MRILILNQLFKVDGGTEVIAINTYKLLKEAGHEVFFFASDEGKESWYEKDYKYAKYFPRRIISSKEYIKHPISYYWHFKAAKLFSKMIDEVKPDLIHIHSLLSPSLLKVCKEKKIPTVMTLHMMPSVCPSTKFLYQNKTICDDFKCKNGNYLNCLFNKCRDNSLEASLRKTILSYVFSLTDAYSAVDCFICPSDALRKYVSMTNICKDKNKLVTINTYTKLTEEEPNYNNKGYFLYFGRLSREKGMPYLFDAIKNLPKDICFHIAGKGPMYEELKTLTEEQHLDNVKLLGFVNDEQKKEEYKNCIATILPCNWFENCPATPIEGFAYAKPSIASNIGGIPEIVEHNKTGLLFEPGNIEQLKDCILKYWQNPDLVKEHGKNSYIKAHTKYTEKKYLEETLNVYKNVLEASEI